MVGNFFLGLVKFSCRNDKAASPEDENEQKDFVEELQLEISWHAVAGKRFKGVIMTLEDKLSMVRIRVMAVLFPYVVELHYHFMECSGQTLDEIEQRWSQILNLLSPERSLIYQVLQKPGVNDATSRSPPAGITSVLRTRPQIIRRICQSLSRGGANLPAINMVFDVSTQPPHLAVLARICSAQMR